MTVFEVSSEPEAGRGPEGRALHIGVLGAGDRGREYAAYCRGHPGEARVVAVADPSEERRKYFCATHDVPQEGSFASWEQLLDRLTIASLQSHT